MKGKMKKLWLINETNSTKKRHKINWVGIVSRFIFSFQKWSCLKYW